MTLEVCIDSFEGALLASKHGAKRVELCTAFSVGGLTPTIGLVEKCTEVTEVHSMLRNREGDFVYSEQEIEIMLDDINYLAKAGASGFVFGCMTETGEIDQAANEILIKEVKGFGLEATFHRAFDGCNDPKQSLETLIELGFDRLLTSGKEPMAIDGIELIKNMTMWAQGRIEIMAGGGLNASNVMKFAEAGVNALHFTSNKDHELGDPFGMGFKSIPDHEKIASIAKLFY